MVLLTVGVRAEWTSVRSANFFVAGEVTEVEVRAVAVRLEQFRDTFGRLFPKMRVDSRVPTNVLIFRDPETYREFRPRRPDGTPDEGVAGYFLAGESVNYITLAMRGGKADPYHTIFHEYLHFLLNSNTGKNKVPAWLGEGLAQYYETMRVTTDDTALIGEPPQGRIGMLRNGSLLPWRDLFAAERTSLHGTVDVSRSMFYAQSWLLVHYLMHKGQANPSERLDKFLGLIGQNGSTEEALRQAFQLDTAGLDELLRRYIDQPQIPVSVEKLTGKQSEFVESSAQKVPNSLARAYLGDLLIHMNRLDEAEKYLRGAIAADNGISMAHASLGFLLIRRDRSAEAAKHLELAVTKGMPSYFEHFNYAYALSRASGTGGMVSRFPPLTAERMSGSLRRAIELEPSFAESYRLLAFINFVNGENIAEAADLLEKGLALKPGDENFEILLARVLLRLERFDEARKLAERLSSRARDPQIREDASGVFKSVIQYSKAKLQITTNAGSTGVPWSPALVFLKRSWVNESDLARIERYRDISNLNRVLERPRTGEERILGTIERIECSNGNITYNVRSGAETLRFGGNRFDDLRMAVLVTGQHSFKVDCGVRLPGNPAVLAYLPATANRANSIPRLMSITFVPEHFELLPPERLAAARLVVIEDDLLRRDRDAAGGISAEAATPEARWTSIMRHLRSVQQSEQRVSGILESVECSGTSFTAVGSAGGRRLRLKAGPDFMPSWFSVDASQAPLGCGTSPLVQNVIFTFRAGDAATDSDDLQLIAMEFVPEGFPFEAVSGPGH